MKILLVNPTGGPEDEYGALSRAGTELPQLGLASVATSLAGNGFAVKIVDCHIDLHTASSLVELIKAGGYGVVGFSVYVTTEKRTMRLAKAIREGAPETVIIIGGPQVTLAPSNFNKPFFDYIFIGEADLSVVELVRELARGGSGENIAGVLRRKDSGFAGLGGLNLVHNLDALPPVELDKLYDLSRFYPPIHVQGKNVVNVVSVRGCPYPCTFCAAAEVNGRKLRAMSVSRFVDTLEAYTVKGFDSFIIYDDTFTVNKKRAAEIAGEIIKRKLNIVWNCWSRPDCVDVETLSLMREAGCYLVMYGCESMNQKTLDKLRKKLTVDQNLRGIEIAGKAGLLVMSSFMIGLPGETGEDMLNTIKLVNGSGLDLALFPIFEPYPGTPIYEDCRREGKWVKGPYKNALLEDQEEVWIPDSSTREDILRLAGLAHRSFYLRPGFMKSFMKIFYKLPARRKGRMLYSALDYFLLRHFSWIRRSFHSGSRYH
jgi:radical SAM superfamily enzyme YgiQ (UPF0313 family)